jgi:hypothetical protein
MSPRSTTRETRVDPSAAAPGMAAATRSAPAIPVPPVDDATALALGRTILGLLGAARVTPPVDDLLRVRDLPLERKAVAVLVRTGKLRTVRVGRETWTRRSWLDAAIESLPPAHRVEADDDDLDLAVRRRAARRSRTG